MKWLILVFVCCLSITAFAQNSTYIGIGYSQNLSIRVNAPEFRERWSNQLSIFATKEIHPWIEVGAGVNYGNVGELTAQGDITLGVHLENVNLSSIDSSQFVIDYRFNSLEVPLRLVIGKQKTKSKIYAVLDIIPSFLVSTTHSIEPVSLTERIKPIPMPSEVDYRTFNLDVQLGVGYRRFFTPRFGLFIETSIAYHTFKGDSNGVTIRPKYLTYGTTLGIISKLGQE